MPMTSFVLRASAFILCCTLGSAGAQTSDPILGEVRLFASSRCPYGWTQAQGQVIPIQQNISLFSLYGTSYGGNGKTHFALPNLIGRSPAGEDSSRPNWSNGNHGGAESAHLTLDNLPAHTHQPIASTAPASHAQPAAGQQLAQAEGAGLYTTDAGASAQWQTGPAGGSTAFSIRNPYLVMTWCVALTGTVPTRP